MASSARVLVSAMGVAVMCAGTHCGGRALIGETTDPVPDAGTSGAPSGTISGPSGSPSGATGTGGPSGYTASLAGSGVLSGGSGYTGSSQGAAGSGPPGFMGSSPGSGASGASGTAPGSGSSGSGTGSSGYTMDASWSSGSPVWSGSSGSGVISGSGGGDFDATAPMNACTFFGQGYSLGDTFAADCNTCSCTSQGIVCTHEDCLQDADIPADAPIERVCMLDGGIVPVGYRQVSICEDCICTPQGFACINVGPDDGGSRLAFDLNLCSVCSCQENSASCQGFICASPNVDP